MRWKSAIFFLCFCVFFNPGTTVASSLLKELDDREFFENAITSEEPSFEVPFDVSGITVPHHLLAADLIARGFWAASAGRYDRIVIISPDHFRRNKSGATIVGGTFRTVYGSLDSDTKAISEIEEAGPSFLTVDKNGSVLGGDGKPAEHGILALMPFVKKFFPHARVIPIVVGISTTEQQWSELVDLLLPYSNDQTLFVQSTDFSHYLHLGAATQKDQHSLNVISAGAVEMIANLDQPGNLDSKAAMSMQLDLLVRRKGHKATVIANRNSANYQQGTDSNTTSYITVVYTRSAKSGVKFQYDDQERFFIGGDLFLGRYIAPLLVESENVDTIVDSILDVTDGAPLIANIEGALLTGKVPGLPLSLHYMLADQAVPIFKRINLVAGSLANNHSHDLGEIGMRSSQDILNSQNISPLVHGQVVDLGEARVLAVNYIKGRGNETTGFIDGTPDEKICFQKAEPPVILLAHWGLEYTDTFDQQTYNHANSFVKCGFQLIVGSHTHLASSELNLISGSTGLGIFSLGNLIFDQTGQRSSGALLEVRTFQNGTLAANLIPIPNIYDAIRN